MSNVSRTLIATINGAEVGTLLEHANIWSFDYSLPWRESAEAFDLSPHLPRASVRILDGATHRPVQWFFDNLLPEEQAREILAREASIPASDAFGLLAYYGNESAGAITLQSPGEAPPASGYLALSDQELHERIAALPRRSLAAGAPKRMSNAGAQYKLAVCIRDGQLFHPIGDTPSTHLLKPDHVDRELWPHSVANEYFVMRLAQRLGLDVPPVHLRYVPDPVYLIDRFDRDINETSTRRRHSIDACQLLGLDRTFKYQQASAETLVRCIDLCQNRARARQRMLAWSLFNLLVGNADAHLKNLSFLVGPRGIDLAPFYDLVSTESYRAEHGNDPRWPHTRLSMRIGAAETFASLTRTDFMAFAQDLGVNKVAAVRQLDRFSDTIQRAAEELYQEIAGLTVPNASTHGGELRVLRAIRHSVIHEMIDRLR